MLAFIPALLAVAIVASATPLQKRSAFFPAIATPTEVNRWVVGTQETVTWDASLVPADADTLPWLNLYPGSDFVGPEFIVTLASDIDPRAGSVTFEVPQGIQAGKYYVGLGSEDDVSVEFYIDDADHPFHIEA